MLAPEYSGGSGKGVDEGRYEHPQQMRSYASVVMQSVLPSRVEYVQYAHPVNEVLLQCLEQAGQPIPATAAFLQNDLAMMVVEELLDQIELMRRQRMTVLEQIERSTVTASSGVGMGTCMYCCMAAAMTDEIGKRGINLEVSEPLAELSLEASNQIMSDAPAVQQEQRSEVPQAPVASSSKAGASSQGGARVVPELPAPHVQLAAAESHRLLVSVPAPDVLRSSKHCRGQKPQADTSKIDVVNFPSNVPA
ncbi:hypothetical protein C0995_009196 [Termitomyces sp. Mi166|nr:hypothetical protein C0995_009196 [Termitomyces sp. Mi166\